MALLHSLTAAASLLSRPIDFGVNHSHMPGQCIVAREGFLLGAQMTADLLLTSIVDRIFMSRQIIGPRKHGVARLPRRWVDPFTLVGSSLRVAGRRRVTGDQMAARGRLAMGFTLVLLKLGRRFEAY